MTNEEAKLQMHEAFEEEYLRGYKQGFKDRANQSDLESRTCENCKYCEVVYSYIYPLCTENKDEPFQLHNSLKTKCNKWSKKDG